MPIGFRQIAAEIREQIISVQYSPGVTLPTAAEFADQYGCSEATVQRAFDQLRSEGLIRPRSGRGTVVNPVPIIVRDAAARQRRATREESGSRGAFDAELRRLGLEPRSDAETGRGVAEDSVNALLGLEPGTETIYRRRKMYASGSPVQLATSYLPTDVAETAGAETPDTGVGGLYSRLEDAGFGPAQFTERIRVRTPEAGEAEFLGLDPDHRVYVVTRIARTADGRAVEACVHVMPAHQWELVYEWDAE